MPPQRRGIGFVFQHYAAFKHLTVRDNVAFGLQDPQAAEGRDQGEGRQPSRSGGARGFPDPLSQPALGRSASAHGAGARARGRPAGAAARRAVRCAGRQGSRRPAGLAAPAARRGARHHRAGHPRPGGGARCRRPDRGAQQGPHRAGRLTDGGLRHARQRVRDVVPRRGVLAERHHWCGRTTFASAAIPRWRSPATTTPCGPPVCVRADDRSNRRAGLRGSRGTDQRGRPARRSPRRSPAATPRRLG